MFIRRKKLSNRLLIVILCIALLPLFIGGVYLIQKTKNEIQLVARERLHSQTIGLSNFFETRFLTPLRYFMLDLRDNPDNLSKSKVTAILTKHKSIKPYIQKIVELDQSDPSRRSVLYGSPIDEKQFSSIEKKMISKFFSDSAAAIRSYISGSNDEKKYLWMGSKSRHNSLCLVKIDLSEFLLMIKKDYRSGHSGVRFGIFDNSSGDLLYYSSGISPEQKPLHYEKLFSPGNMLASHYYRYQNSENAFTGAFSDVSSYVNLRIVAEIPYKQIIAPVKNIWYKFGALLGFGILLSLLGTTYLGKKITAPLERFARSATEIARGDFNQKIKVESNDEIGRLSQIFNYMAIELRRLNSMNLNKIITERTKTKAIIKNIGDGVIVSDREDRIVTVNATIEKWFQLSEEDVNEKLLTNIRQFPDLMGLINDIKENKFDQTFTREFTVNLPDKSEKTVFQARATKIISHDDKFIGVVSILRDITQEKEIDRMKTELVSMVAHELKSPLTSISGFAELLLYPEENPEVLSEYAKVIKEEATRLTDLINKFLDVTKIESGRMDFHPRLVPVRQILDGMLYLASSEAQKKNIDIKVDLSNENCEAYVDEKMISEVILNLLSNAIKYSPEKTQVQLHVEDNSENVALTVRDQGFGISSDHLPHIFDKFYRIKDDPDTQEETGTGLGLALVKEIVELHNGNISVHSQKGEGTMFRIELPKRKVEVVEEV